ncbi:hypothetical protein [Pseudarthrobacter equi]|uniref:hypothetical protein n=1 Tax=Pseudarthrobacter equi TaxID=728066 RepID=UPI0028D4B1A3|nr:hypothetical protein [Pseudarthrobacter equi]
MIVSERSGQGNAPSSVKNRAQKYWGSSMEPQKRMGPEYPHKPPNPPQHHYAQNPRPYPQHWAPPPPKKSKKGRTGWILGIIAVFLTICGIFVFAGCSALVREVNGGGGSQAEKAAAMSAAVDNVPGDGWTETYRFQRKVDPGCLSIDTHCLRLEAAWAVDHEVTVDEVASRLGQSIDEFEFEGSGDGTCMTNRDSNSMTQICVGDSADGGHGARVTMTRK